MPELVPVLGVALPTLGALLALLFRTEARITRVETLIEGLTRGRA